MYNNSTALSDGVSATLKAKWKNAGTGWVSIKEKIRPKDQLNWLQWRTLNRLRTGCDKTNANRVKYKLSTDDRKARLSLWIKRI